MARGYEGGSCVCGGNALVLFEVIADVKTDILLVYKVYLGRERMEPCIFLSVS